MSALKRQVNAGVALFSLLIAGVLFYLMFSDGSSVGGLANSYVQTGAASSVRASLAQFQRLRDGMTYTEAVSVLGSSGMVQSRSNSGDIVTIMYSWPGSGSLGANMNAMFKNDQLVTKAQFGLW